LLSTCSAPHTHPYTAAAMPASTAQLSRTAGWGKHPAPQPAAAPLGAEAAAKATAGASSAANTTVAAAAAAAAATSATADAADTSSAAASPADDVTAGGSLTGSRPGRPPAVGGLKDAPPPGGATAAPIGRRLTFQTPGLCWGREAEGGRLGERRGDRDAAVAAAERRWGEAGGEGGTGEPGLTGAGRGRQDMGKAPSPRRRRRPDHRPRRPPVPR